MKSKFLGTLILLIGLFIIDIKTGSVTIKYLDIFNSFISPDKVDFQTKLIIREIRFPRTLTALLVGISLSVSGLLLQTLFKNPLAGPYIFGISAGAGFGVSILLLGISFLGLSINLNGFSIAIAGIIGSFLVLAIILFISFKIRDNLTVLIVGVFMGSGLGALINLMQYFAPASMLKKYIIWTMGSLDSVQNNQLIGFSIIIFTFSFFAFLLSKYLDALYLGEENAGTLGVNLKRVRLFVFIITGIMTGLVTAYVGPIGFIGIAVPHISRMILKTSKHLNLLIFSSITGAIIMIFSDIISHSFQSAVIPINSITALIGLPIIFLVIFRNRNFY